MATSEGESGEADRKRRLKPILFRIVLGLLPLLPLECGARLVWSARGVPFLSAPRRIYRSFYPGLAVVERQFHEDDSEGCFDILLLGGSALHEDYGDIEHVLRERLIRATRRCVRIHNLAAPAHTTLDSLYKYKHLDGYDFDLVLVYHGINEIRANNCTADQYRDDYSHLSWYRLINDFERHADSRWFALPYTIKFISSKAADRLGWSDTLPTHRPTPESVAYGCEVKTADSFRGNLDSILQLAGERRQPVVLMTFAYHLPDDYTEARFDDRALDYSTHRLSTELWGKPECVVAGLRAHNDAVRSVASRYEGARLVDQEALIGKKGLHFNDICHLTHEGCERFAENVLPVVLPLAKRLR